MPLMNRIEAYEEAGRKEALARNVGDEATAKHWRQHYVAMRNLEYGSDKGFVTLAFNRGYKAARVLL